MKIETELDKSFRVIIVGAGISGLTWSNALHKAGIKHVVLEKHSRVVFLLARALAFGLMDPIYWNNLDASLQWLKNVQI